MPGEFMRKLYPCPASRAQFEYPDDGLMPLRDFVTEGELLRPTMVDENGEECIIVLKNGTGAGVTLGRASGIKSFVRI